MIPLPDVAKACGYTVISNKALTVMELSGNGNWSIFELACHQFVKHSHFGHAYDHVSIIVRHVGGERELRDVGVNGVRYGTLPCVGFKEKRIYAGSGIRGVRKEGNRYRCLITVKGQKLHLGMFSTEKEAGMRRDKYVRDHNLSVTLNYPDLVPALTCV